MKVIKDFWIVLCRIVSDFCLYACSLFKDEVPLKDNVPVEILETGSQIDGAYLFAANSVEQQSTDGLGNSVQAHPVVMVGAKETPKEKMIKKQTSKAKKTAVTRAKNRAARKPKD